MLSLNSGILVCLSLLRAATTSAHLRVAFMWGRRKRVTGWPWAYTPYSFSQGAEAIEVNWRSPRSIQWDLSYRWAYLMHSRPALKKQAKPRMQTRRRLPSQTKRQGRHQSRRQLVEAPKIMTFWFQGQDKDLGDAHFWSMRWTHVSLWKVCAVTCCYLLSHHTQRQNYKTCPKVSFERNGGGKRVLCHTNDLPDWELLASA